MSDRVFDRYGSRAVDVVAKVNLEAIVELDLAGDLEIDAAEKKWCLRRRQGHTTEGRRRIGEYPEDHLATVAVYRIGVAVELDEVGVNLLDDTPGGEKAGPSAAEPTIVDEPHGEPLNEVVTGIRE